jgi:hypothetical protein
VELDASILHLDPVERIRALTLTSFRSDPDTPIRSRYSPGYGGDSMASFLPFKNARLTAVTRPAVGRSLDGWDEVDDEELEDTTVWAGTADAFYREKLVTETRTGELNLFRDIRLQIPRVATIAQGDRVTIAHPGGEETFTVRELSEDYSRLHPVDILNLYLERL